ncbi:hypothetical protein [Jannaschia seohaensis]|uniref:Uncharacterized protein n=1 Tax=Jannaschia seohaensis TaxID=475081 RepID=A0A2Y9ABQ8_9RHOB|nr:hypothetical protein [Jannaschia seohaensis]PWJ21418.1 hypothetical protein BCF38_102671 [Jannaschia seohaensis]SSA42024.1 hypothetical protein SAMN05421539_102671 [Jannaschia seohaensis]
MAANRRRLEIVSGDRDTPQTHLRQARIVLLSADGIGTNAIVAAIGIAKTRSGAGRNGSRKYGVDGLRCDRSRPPVRARVADRIDDARVAWFLSNNR